jgi:allantoinase
MMLRSHGRYEYSAITQRPDFTWPGGKRLAFYIGLNLEHFSFGEGLGATLAPSHEPDVLNYSWRDYGNRVGAWRMLELFDSFGLPASVLVNSELYGYCPQLLAAFRERYDEIVAHGRTNAERQGPLAEDEERRLIVETTQCIARHEGKSPNGWLGPWISQSDVTPDLLQEAGYTYLLDWCNDDQPVWFKTRAGKILSVPYPQEMNDIPAIVVRQHTASEFAEMIVDQFEEMRSQSQSEPLVFSLALHAYVVGQPFRLRHLRRALSHIARFRDSVWFCHAGAIAEHFTALETAVIR